MTILSLSTPSSRDISITPQLGYNVQMLIPVFSSKFTFSPKFTSFFDWVALLFALYISANQSCFCLHHSFCQKYPHSFLFYQFIYCLLIHQLKKHGWAARTIFEVYLSKSTHPSNSSCSYSNLEWLHSSSSIALLSHMKHLRL